MTLTRKHTPRKAERRRAARKREKEKAKRTTDEGALSFSFSFDFIEFWLRFSWVKERGVLRRCRETPGNSRARVRGLSVLGRYEGGIE